ncbi:Hypothetical protein NTJ_07002 [Nesidiocoris tenuis]|uniref:Uncharacterized protein n=1 Tax=Nesidiocoris tenuis TaxID=355587 RepID=A0ABN7AQE7_9HEMI|nr:Hypothetical protein NTJ_07002 [Nesidiocoris tenuis]
MRRSCIVLSRPIQEARRSMLNFLLSSEALVFSGFPYEGATYETAERVFNALLPPVLSPFQRQSVSRYITPVQRFARNTGRALLRHSTSAVVRCSEGVVTFSMSRSFFSFLCVSVGLDALWYICNVD